MNPSDFHLLASMKEHLRECNFTDDENVICTTSGWLEDHTHRFFYSRIHALEKHWNLCVSVAGGLC